MSMKDFARTVIRMSADTMKKEEANFYASDMVWIDINPPWYLLQNALLVPITTAKYLIGSDEVDITLDSVKITKVYISISAYVFSFINVEQHDNTAGTGVATELIHSDGFIQTIEIPIRNGWRFSYGESVLVTVQNIDHYTPGHEVNPTTGVDSHRYSVTLLGTAKPNMEDLRAKLEARGITI